MKTDHNVTTSTYFNNPFIKPVIKFHFKVASCFSRLPDEGKALEIAKRVAIVAISPFGYLVLGLSSLIGLAFHPLYKNKSAENLSDQPAQKVGLIPNQEKLLSVASECEKVRTHFIFTIKRNIQIDQLESAKILFNMECDEKKFSKDRIVKELDSSPLSQNYLSEALDTILNQAKAVLSSVSAEKINFRWVVLLKDTNGNFHEANGSRKCFFAKNDYQFQDHEGGGKHINPTKLTEYFNLVLEGMHRELTPQLDNQLNFV